MFGLSGARKHLFAICLVATIVLTVAPQAIARTVLDSMPAPNLSPITVATTMNQASLNFTSSRPVTVTTELGTSKAYGLLVPEGKARATHSVAVSGLNPATTYYYKVTVTARQLKKSLIRTGTFTTGPMMGPVEAGVHGGAITLDGVPFFPILAWSSSCFGSDTIAADLSIGVNVFEGDASRCKASKDVDGMAMLDNLAGKAWYVNDIGQLGEPTVSSYTGLIGWNQPVAAESYYRPEEMVSPPEKGRLVFYTPGAKFWDGEIPGWGGNNDEPVWNVATVQAYFTKADVLGWISDPYACNGGRPTPDAAFQIQQTLQHASHKPTIEWIRVAEPGCQLTPAEATSQLWLAVAAGAKGVGFYTFGLVSGSIPTFDVTAGVRGAVLAADTKIAALMPALLTPSIALKLLATSAVKAGAHRYRGVLYITAVNPSNKPARLRLKLPGISKGIAQILGSQRRLNLKDGVLTDSFGPLTWRVYRVAPMK